MDDVQQRNFAMFGGDATHGGDVWGWARRLGRPVQELLDLSASVNPLGPPPGLKEAVDQAMELVCHYPDRLAHDLRQILSTRLDMDPSCLLPGNGSTALIRMLARALDLKNIQVVAPAFGEFARSLATSGRHFHYLITREENAFAPVMEDVEHIWEQSPAAVFLSNPVSPSGVLIDQHVLDSMLYHAARRRSWLVVDEAFIDFAPPEARQWAAKAMADNPRLIVLRSLTKFYCLAGLRLGYAMAQADTLGEFAPLGEPWSVNTLAQAAGVFCLGQEKYEEKTRAAIDAWRPQQADALTGLGLEVFPSQANYLLCRLPAGGPDAAQVAQSTAQQGVLVRDASSFVGCTERHMRVAVTTDLEQKRLVAALESALTQA